jgi:hypothetical protein
VKKPAGAVWLHIDLLQASLTCFFCLSAFDHIKTTRISRLYHLYLVNMTCLVAPAHGEHASAAGKRSHIRRWARLSPWPHADSGWAEKPFVAVWQHIDLFQVSLACFFCTEALYHIKTIRIPALHLCMMYLYDIFSPVSFLSGTMFA